MRVSHLMLGAATAFAIAVPAFALGPVASAGASTHTVKMLNRGEAGMMVFEPSIVRIKPGESVTFVPTDKGHNAESIPGMVAAGALPFKGGMNKEVTVAFTKPGVYGIKCAPHLGMGMVGVVIVGNATNLAEAKTVVLPGKAKLVMAGLLAGVR